MALASICTNSFPSQASDESIEGVFHLIALFIGDAALDGIADDIAYQNADVCIFQLFRHLSHVDRHRPVVLGITVGVNQFGLSFAHGLRPGMAHLKSGVQLILKSSGHFISNVLAEVQMNVKGGLRLLLCSFAGYGIFIVAPGDRHRYGVLLEKADAVVPVQELRIIFINDLRDGRIKISTGIADEAHSGSQHVIPVLARTETLVHHSDALADINLNFQA